MWKWWVCILNFTISLNLFPVKISVKVGAEKQIKVKAKSNKQSPDGETGSERNGISRHTVIQLSFCKLLNIRIELDLANASQKF